MKYDASIKTPFSNLGLRFEDDALVAIDFLRDNISIRPAHKTAARVCKQLHDYASGKAKNGFKINLKTEGTLFQQKVWRALQKIPHGKFTTYGELAKKLNTSPRAIGNACRANPIPVIIPCHRVVSCDGPGGYAGKTSGAFHTIKAWLLKHEGYRTA